MCVYTVGDHHHNHKQSPFTTRGDDNFRDIRMSDETVLSTASILLTVVPTGNKMSVNVLQNQQKCVSTITGRVKLWLGSEEAFKTTLHSPAHISWSVAQKWPQKMSSNGLRHGYIQWLRNWWALTCSINFIRCEMRTRQYDIMFALSYHQINILHWCNIYFTVLYSKGCQKLFMLRILKYDDLFVRTPFLNIMTFAYFHLLDPFIELWNYKDR